MKKNEENDNIRVIYYHYLAKKKIFILYLVCSM